MSKLNILTIGQSNIAGFADFTDTGKLNSSLKRLANWERGNIKHGVFHGLILKDEVFNTNVNKYKNKKQYMTYYKGTDKINTWLPLLGYYLLKNHSANADLIPNTNSHISEVCFYNAGVGSTTLSNWLDKKPINKIKNGGVPITNFIDGQDFIFSPFARVERLNQGLKVRDERFDSVVIEIGESDNIFNTSAYMVYANLKHLISKVRKLSQIDSNTPIYVVFGTYVQGDIDRNVLNGLYSAVKQLSHVYMGDIPDYYLKGSDFRRGDNIHFDLAGGLYHAYWLATKMAQHREY